METVQKQEVDASQHLRLIWRVINQLGLVGDMAEEAYSEGLVAITKAAKRYDPTYNVPVANWLSTEIRGYLLNWLNKEKPVVELPTYLAHKYDQIDARVELNEVISIAKRILTPFEHDVIMATAVGFSGVEIAKELKATTIQVHRAKMSGQKKLKEAI